MLTLQDVRARFTGFPEAKPVFIYVTEGGNIRACFKLPKGMRAVAVVHNSSIMHALRAVKKWANGLGHYKNETQESLSA